MKTIKERLLTKVTASANTILDEIPRKKSNRDPLLATMFVWDTISDLAKKRSKEAWTLAQKDGVIPKDEDIKAKGTGEHLVTDSDNFSVRAEVKAGANKFDLDTYINAVAKALDLDDRDKLKIIALADDSKKTGSPSLTLSVLEAAAV